MLAPAFRLGLTCRRPLQGRAAEVRGLRLAGRHVEADGLCRVAWSVTRRNTVTMSGRNAVGETMFNGAPQVVAWYIGLAGIGAKDVNDTAGLHPGWTEVVAYDNPTRAPLVLGTFVSGVADNVVAPAVFQMNGPYTVSGSFVISDGVKGGTDGLLYNMSDWLDQNGSPAPRSGFSGDSVTAQAQVGL